MFLNQLVAASYRKHIQVHVSKALHSFAVCLRSSWVASNWSEISVEANAVRLRTAAEGRANDMRSPSRHCSEQTIDKTSPAKTAP